MALTDSRPLLFGRVCVACAQQRHWVRPQIGNHVHEARRCDLSEIMFHSYIWKKLEVELFCTCRTSYFNLASKWNGVISKYSSCLVKSPASKSQVISGYIHGHHNVGFKSPLCPNGVWIDTGAPFFKIGGLLTNLPTVDVSWRRTMKMLIRLVGKPIAWPFPAWPRCKYQRKAGQPDCINIFIHAVECDLLEGKYGSIMKEATYLIPSLRKCRAK